MALCYVMLTNTGYAFACECVFLYLLHTQYQYSHSTSKLRTFLKSEHILTGPRNFKGLFEG